jgi:uracil-DNA glycosylase family 4
MSWDDEFFSCAGCGTSQVVGAIGPEKSPLLIIGSAPGEDEIKAGLPFVGRTGNVLKNELRRAGLDFHAFRICNLWQHMLNDKKECQQAGAEAAIKEAKGRSVILLIGAEAVKFFTGLSVEGYNGLSVPSNYLSAPVIMACVQPTTVYHNSVGEIRLTISKLASKINGLGL